MRFSTWEVIRSYLFGITLESSSSEQNTLLEVNLVNNKPVLNSARVNYSFGALHKIFQKAFRIIDISPDTIGDVLILGFGAGSVASIITREYKINCRITGVESDPEVIRLARKYFELDSYPDLKLVIDDACTYVSSCLDKYDLVVIDVYDDFRVPECCETPEFLSNVHGLMREKGLVVFNKMMFNKQDERLADRLVENFEKEFRYFQKHRIRESVPHLILAGMDKVD